MSKKPQGNHTANIKSVAMPSFLVQFCSCWVDLYQAIKSDRDITVSTRQKLQMEAMLKEMSLDQLLLELQGTRGRDPKRDTWTGLVIQALSERGYPVC